MNTICYRRKLWKRKKSKDPRYDTLKTIKKNPRKVSLEDIETGEIEIFSSIYKAGKFIDQAQFVIGMVEFGRINTML